MSAHAAEDDPDFEALLTHIKDSRGFDFTGYKRPSLLRRVQRRMQTLQIDSYVDYLDRLEVEGEEFTALFNTILINVTSFFRDPEAWAYLQSDLVPELLTLRGEAPLRMWSAGCATGAEAYSVAMCLAELMGIDTVRRRVKIYATDVDEEALAQARLATYSAKEISGVPPELVQRYFEPSGNQWVFTKQLRRCVIFGRNDLVQDAPISHIDLLLCRNTLMYFHAETQARILNRLHYALEPGGLLFLGKAELLLSHGSQLQPVEGMRRFFRKVVGDPARERALLLGFGGSRTGSEHGDKAVIGQIRQEAMLSAPTAQVVVDAVGRVVAGNHRAEILFGLSVRQTGQAFADLDMSMHPVELRPLLDQVMRDRRTLWIREVEWTRPGMETLYFDVQIVPLSGDVGAVLGVTIIFNDVTRQLLLQRDLEFSNHQLETASEELQSTNEELETTNEELQSTVEELETTNEELQSTNEELETMNEELQSMNDELGSTNDQLRQRAGQFDVLVDFMESILTGLKVGVVVVDRELMVTAWNTPAQQLWGLRAEEAIGAHLLNLDIGLPLDQLKALLREILSGSKDGHSAVLIDAVNRRGRRVTVQVTLSPLVGGGDGDRDVVGAILVMDEVLDEQLSAPTPVD